MILKIKHVIHTMFIALCTSLHVAISLASYVPGNTVQLVLQSAQNGSLASFLEQNPLLEISTADIGYIFCKLDQNRDAKNGILLVQYPPIKAEIDGRTMPAIDELLNGTFQEDNWELAKFIYVCNSKALSANRLTSQQAQTFSAQVIIQPTGPAQSLVAPTPTPGLTGTSVIVNFIKDKFVFLGLGTCACLAWSYMHRASILVQNLENEDLWLNWNIDKYTIDDVINELRTRYTTSRTIGDIDVQLAQFFADIDTEHSLLLEYQSYVWLLRLIDANTLTDEQIACKIDRIDTLRAIAKHYTF